MTIPATNHSPLTDIRVENRLDQIPAMRTVIERRHASRFVYNDIGTVSGHDCLAQAIILRLTTPKGELTPLGHPEYGSNLHHLEGMRNTETARSLLRLHILDSLRTEPRIAEAVSVHVEQDCHRPNIANVSLKVIPVNETQSVSIGPFAVELEL